MTITLKISVDALMKSLLRKVGRPFFKRNPSVDPPQEDPPREAISRCDFLLQGVNKAEIGLEIAPFFRPLAPKVEGFQVETIDVLSTDQLRQWIRDDPSLPNDLVGQIEEVDHVGSASRIKETIQYEGHKKYAYIISSHNFEHLPNPIQFLRDCDEILAENGQICMAIPDLRCCFDRFRMPTQLDEWVQSFCEQKASPSPYDRFRAWYKRCNNIGHLNHRKSEIVLHPNPVKDLKFAFAELQQSLCATNLQYQDCHVSAFTPSSFTLLIKESIELGLINLDVVDLVPTVADEFLVRLKKVREQSPMSSDQRHDLYFAMLEELGHCPSALN